MKLLTFLLATILLSLPVHAKVFRNAYIVFEMPETWKCTLEVTEWVCRAESGNEAKEAIIILTAKEAGPTDAFPLYEQHLNVPIVAAAKGATSESKVQYKAKNVNINDQPWVDGLHLGSEVPNYFTRYLATIKDKIAILVTLSAHKNYYTRYSAEFFKTVQSLKVIATKNLGGKPDLGPLRPGSETLGPGTVNGAMPGDITGDDPNGAGKGKAKTWAVIFALVLLAIGLGMFFWKKRKNR